MMGVASPAQSSLCRIRRRAFLKVKLVYRVIICRAGACLRSAKDAGSSQQKKSARGEQQIMKLGFFTMPIHTVEKDWRQSLREDREAFLLADELGFSEAYVGEHVTDKAENITSSIAFIAWIAAATRQI